MNTQEEYRKERKKLELNRSLDWSTFGVEHKVAGEILKPMTVQVWFDLLAMQSPLISSELPTLEAIIDYIWRNSKKKTSNPLLKQWRLWMIERRVAKDLKKKDTAEALIEVVLDHINTSLNEFPSSVSSARQSRTNSVSMYSGDASMIDEIASRYSMHPDEVLNLPLRKAFSLQRVIRVTTIPDYKMLEPESLRAIKTKHLQQLNNGK